MKRFLRTAFIFTFIYLLARELVPWQIYKVRSESGIQTEYFEGSTQLSNSATKKHRFVLGAETKYKICVNSTCDSTFNKSSIDIEILTENLELGLSKYIPVYKQINVKYSLQYRTKCLIEKNDSIKELIKEHRFIANGPFKLIGICSGRQAKTLIRNTLLTQVLIETRKSLTSELKI